MKYVIALLIGMTFVSCAKAPKKPEVKKPVNDRFERIMKCVDRYVDKGVDSELAFKECKGLFGR